MYVPIYTRPIFLLRNQVDIPQGSHILRAGILGTVLIPVPVPRFVRIVLHFKPAYRFCIFISQRIDPKFTLVIPIEQVGIIFPVLGIVLLGISIVANL